MLGRYRQCDLVPEAPPSLLQSPSIRLLPNPQLLQVPWIPIADESRRYGAVRRVAPTTVTGRAVGTGTAEWAGTGGGGGTAQSDPERIIQRSL